VRRPLSLGIAVLVAVLGALAPAAGGTALAATSDAKVVIIVGATHSVTAAYRADADDAYAEAIKYTSNVVKVYSPNATWAKVKAATAGASIVIYFGHGNGWPSPYPNDAAYTSKDGFGLNYDLNGDGKLSDYENHYYGEPSVSTLDLAPNAVVILSHLCYASGNSEPGMAAPSLSVARQRVDNYGAGFLKAGAQAVIADGHAGPEGYIRSLFTTHQSILDVWTHQSNFHDHVSSFASTRTPGATAYMDPDTTSGGYYRSLVAQPGLTSDAVVEAPSGSGPVVVDTKAPSLTFVSPVASDVRWISPNGDLAKESITWQATASEGGSVGIRIRDGDGTTVRSTAVAAKAATAVPFTWTGRDDAGDIVPDGTYTATFTPKDAAGNVGKAVSRTVVVDTSLGDVDASTILFFPQDGDALAATSTLRFKLTRAAVVTWTLVDANGNVARTLLDGVSLPAGEVTRVVDGKRADGTWLPRGAYRSTVTLAGEAAPVISQYRTITMRAFVPTASDATPARGQKVTISATSAEPLSAAPKVTVTQPGKAAWSVTMTKVATGKYQATLTLKTGGGTGSVLFRVTGKDSGGQSQSADLSLPLH
jgi:flagellar hook assembly protein FlgD